MDLIIRAAAKTAIPPAVSDESTGIFDRCICQIGIQH
jgi:hypothetical protein